MSSQNSRFYYDGVTTGDPNVHNYYRHFEAPGVGHCYTGTGLYPAGIFDSMVRWVEAGEVPDYLKVDVFAGKQRILCPYPQKARYKGTGDTYAASSYYCSI
jgi:hypothetical protein